MPRGIYPRPKVYVPRKEDHPALVWTVDTLYGQGYTQREIASALDWSLKRVQGVFRRNGIDTRAAKRRDQEGENNPNWRGHDALYAALHMRVERKRGKPSVCGMCGTSDPSKTYDWANLNGNYHDTDDYMRMCRSCHRKYDLGHEFF